MAWHGRGSAFAAAVGALVLLAPALGSASSDPTLASYTADTDRIFWFVHVTDIHVGAGDTSRDNLALMVNEGQAMLQPWFYVASGDLVEDGRTGEWQDYRDIITSAGLGTDNWFDVPGNHDNNLNGDDSEPGFLDYYLQYSITGAAYGEVHHNWVVDTGFGRYQLVGVYTDGGADRRILPDELLFVETALTNTADARLAFVFGHHPLRGNEAAEPADCQALEALMNQHGVSLYLYGHVHTLVEQLWPHEYTNLGYLSWQSQTLGKPEIIVSPPGFSLLAVDSDYLIGRVVTLVQPLIGPATLPSPIVLVTAPADWSFGYDNPYAYPVSQAASDNPVRALVFSRDPLQEVRFRFAGQPWQGMTHVSGPLWQGTLDGTIVGDGGTLEVQAEAGGQSDSHVIEIRSTPLAECEDGQDNDADGAIDFPEDPGCTAPFDSDEREPHGVPPYEPGTGGSAGQAGSVPEGGAGAWPAGGGGAGTGAQPGSPGPTASSDSSGGCGCRTAPPARGHALVLLWLAAGLLRRRRGGDSSRRERAKPNHRPLCLTAKP